MQASKIKVKVVGAGGFGGVGIIELLLSHPSAEITALVDVTDIGARISDIYPHLAGFCDMAISAADAPAARAPADVVFMATPDGVGMKLAEHELAAGAKVIDYSGDFRFNTVEAYRDYASRIGRSPEHASPHLLAEAVYGLPELHRAEITPRTRLIGNPGCFAVSCILGLAPAVKAGLAAPDSIICDCKTGVSGAGKKPSPTFHYPARYEQMNAYKLAGHQHICEIERELGILAGGKVVITFTAQVVPICRGIMSSLYAQCKTRVASRDAFELYREFYKNEPFVRVWPRDAAIGSMHTRGTNFCNLVVDVDERANRLRVISHIDNLMKGQAGSALQNMNLMFGMPENAGLTQPGRYP